MARLIDADRLREYYNVTDPAGTFARGTTTKIMPNRVVVYPNDYVNVVRCAYCKHCFDMGSDPMEPYDGESEWYCERFDMDTSVYEIDPYRFFCANGERRDDDAAD